MYLHKPKPGLVWQRTPKDFILLFSQKTGVGQEIRCLVRKVTLRPMGNFMTAQVQIDTNTRTTVSRISVSGDYGNDGLTIDARKGSKEGVPAQFWDRMHVLPQALADLVWSDKTGWNNAGLSGENVRQWALPRAEMLSKWLRIEDLYKEAQDHIDRGTLIVVRAAEGLGLKSKRAGSVGGNGGIRTVKGLPVDQDWFHKQVCKYLIHVTKRWANVVMPEEWRDKL